MPNPQGLSSSVQVLDQFQATQVETGLVSNNIQQQHDVIDHLQYKYNETHESLWQIEQVLFATGFLISVLKYITDISVSANYVFLAEDRIQFAMLSQQLTVVLMKFTTAINQLCGSCNCGTTTKFSIITCIQTAKLYTIK